MEENNTQVDTPNKTNYLPVVLVIVALLVVGGVFLTKAIKKGDSSMSPTSTNAPEVMVAPETTSAPAMAESVKEFTVDGSNFKFDPTTITVNKGDTVKITFKDDDGFHDLAVDGYNVKTETIQKGGASSVTFTADKIGTFEYYCSVDSHREKGMTGKLIVQ